MDWGSTQQEVFDKAKKLLTSAELLLHCNPAKPYFYQIINTS